MTTTYNSTSDKDKDFQNTIDEHFKDISKQIRSLQKALANFRHDQMISDGITVRQRHSRKLQDKWMDRED
jgi:hypothetical protein